MLLVIGGENKSSGTLSYFTGDLTTLSDVWLLDLKTWRWSEVRWNKLNSWFLISLHWLAGKFGSI